MKRALALAAAAAATFTFTQSALARVNWQGEFMVTGVTSACASDGWAVGDHALATYLPANLDNNGARSFIALHLNRRNAYSYGVTGALAAGKGYSAVGITSAGSNFTFTGAFVAFTQSPASVVTTTPFVTMRARISNFSGMPGCTVSFDASFVKRR